MAIEVTCPECGADYSVPETLAGKRIKCKSCGGAVAAAKPLTARPVTARPVKAAAVVDDDEPAVPARKARYADDDVPARRGRAAEPPARQKSALPLVLGGFVAACLLIGGVGAGVYFSGLLDEPKPDVVTNTNTDGNSHDARPTPNAVSRPGVDDAGKGVDDRLDPTDPSVRLKPNSANGAGRDTPLPSAGEGPGGGAIVVTPPTQPILKAPGVTKEPAAPRTTPDEMALQRAKEAAVYFEVETNDSAASGSGWFGIEPNLIITNSHVLFMLAPNAPKPKKITVYVNPGTNEERIIPHAHLEILAVDRFADLAVLRVLNESDLPVPLKIRPSQELRDVEPLVVIGYPGGRRYSAVGGNTKAPRPTVSRTDFSNHRLDGDGNLYWVQYRGGGSSGNSGGPVVDMYGNLVAVHVAGPTDPKFSAFISFGVPSELVAGLLAGRVADVEYGQAYRKGGKVHVPVKANVLDPFQRMKEVRIAGWVGEPSKKTRPPGLERTGVEPSDTGFVETRLDYKWTKDKQSATGELVYPELQEDRAYWAQPAFSNAINDSYWMPGHTVKLDGPPVDLEEADLVYRPKFGSVRPTTLIHSGYLQESDAGERTDIAESDLLRTEIKATETIQRTRDQGSAAQALLNYESLEFKASDGRGGSEDILIRGLPKDVRDILAKNVKLVQGLGYIQKDGSIYKTLSDFRAAQPALAPLIKRFSDDAMQALVDASVPLPNKRVEPNFSWKQEKSVRFQVGYVIEDEKAPPPSAPGGSRPRQVAKVKEYKYVESVTYTFLGTRTRLGSKEAVVKVEGVIKPAPGTSTQGGANGSVKGYAYIDLDTGTVLESELKKEFEMDSSSDGVKKVIASSSNSKVTRGSTR